MSPSAPHFTPAQVTGLRDLGPTVRELTLRPLAPLGPWTPGGHLQVAVHAGGTAALRSYSLVGLPDPAACRIAVKRVAASRGGSRFMWGLREGDCLPVHLPANAFELPRNKRPVALLAGGIGVTPLLGMALQLAAQGTPPRFWYAVRDAADLVYAAPLREALGERLQTFVTAAGQRPDLPACVAALEPDAQLLVCGPLHLLQAAQAAWAQAGRPRADLRFETFGSGGAAAAVPFRVSLPRHGLQLEVPADRSLLDVLEEHGVPTLADCRKGECGLCVLDVVSADAALDHRDVFFSPLQQQRGDKLCACVSRSCGGTLVLDTAWRAGP